jgi:hypothetical protein
LIKLWVEANAPATLPAVATVQTSAAEAARPAASRLTPLIGLLAVLLIVIVLGGAALAGVFDADDDDPGSVPVIVGSPTSTLSLNLEATRQSDILTQTEEARPTITPTPTDTPTPTNTPAP